MMFLQAQFVGSHGGHLAENEKREQSSSTGALTGAHVGGGFARMNPVPSAQNARCNKQLPVKYLPHGGGCEKAAMGWEATNQRGAEELGLVEMGLMANAQEGENLAERHKGGMGAKGDRAASAGNKGYKQ
eukprot:1138846-Pelagomonas_calceolata.AAC.2